MFVHKSFPSLQTYNKHLSLLTREKQKTYRSLSLVPQVPNLYELFCYPSISTFPPHLLSATPPSKLIDHLSLLSQYSSSPHPPLFLYPPTISPSHHLFSTITNPPQPPTHPLPLPPLTPMGSTDCRGTASTSSGDGGRGGTSGSAGRGGRSGAGEEGEVIAFMYSTSANERNLCLYQFIKINFTV